VHPKSTILARVRISRRRVLAAATGLALAASTTIAVVRTRGYDVPPEKAARLRVLSRWQYVVLAAAARRIAAPDVGDGSVPSTDDVDVAGFLDGYLLRLPDNMRRDFSALLAFIEHLAPLGCKLGSRFTRLSAQDQDRVLSSLESSREGLLRGGFDGLKSMVFMGYYRDPRTWKVIGYAGPFVRREGAG
jgi:Gluconate 2-dehydrogenase subunit 3